MTRRPLPGRLRLLGLFVAGVGLAVLAHYLLYRFSLPSKPFIYVSF